MKSSRKESGRVTRRGFLAGSSALITGAVLGSEQLTEAQQAAAAAAARPGSGPSRMIDVHHHFVPPEWSKYVQSIGGGNTPPWSAQGSIELMDKTGFATAILSLTDPGVEDAAVCRVCNDAGAKLVADSRGRFGLFASLPLPDVDASLKELAYAMDTLHADGVVMQSHCSDLRYIGDPSFAPVHEEMNRRRTVVFVHPHNPWYQGRNAPPVPKFAGWGIPELPNDTTRGVLSLMSEGTVDKYPNIKWILSHCGGTMPFMLSRIGVLGSRTNGFKTSGYEAAARIASTFYYDFTNTVEPPSVRAVMALARPANVLFGTDYPYGDGRNQNGEFVVLMRAALANVGLTEAQVAGIARNNAEVLFPRLKG